MSASSLERLLPDPAATERLGADLARALGQRPIVIHLQGDLGAGKTTLARGLLRALDHAGPVRSPTYTLMEPYSLGCRRVLHLDLYRMADPEELEYLGLREEVGKANLILVEWPEQGGELLPAADLLVALRDQDEGRMASVQALTREGLNLLARLAGTSADVQ
ncbi:tRNA (adenosine(37)-N6)-threonylcarbamoyltransferase complex ATPase subunit type 1 TsaE [Methylonatrum kenyense]|uniref:tRNA (adenosine(37)-N6)-threonylcarbamoyltransferase complex ATPase subunit type 1 TsaE n=1 Tax=Methylonatrum kenyense TaxID=455253 RepID=UPI0020BD6760|nr:tRNA (adenosine(37)-N6)-threonylcarbamoyltransferase complex ATPase subunit type 1 TsaE [Methylonatrum kenyense]MCK8516117.1 tRNA (adenosine(37)-N6)-threonylcarbamoyltransferase complex ATPase subunit type 1 TsaE [Methylonatrum kenyense]